MTCPSLMSDVIEGVKVRLLVTKQLQKRVRMEIIGSDGIPLIPFSTDYVILLRTVQLLCIQLCIHCRLCIDCRLCNYCASTANCQGHSHPKLLVALGVGSKSSADKIQPTTHKPTGYGQYSGVVPWPQKQ